MKIFRYFIAILILHGVVFMAHAYEHQDSLVDFEEYTTMVKKNFWIPPRSEDLLTVSKPQNKPLFLLFSAQWCHWCHEFANNTLSRMDVVAYLNEHFINVFIDVDIHHSAYTKYRATGVPYVVFLNPDGTIYYRYSGTLYGDNFLDVIKEVVAEAGVGKHAIGMETIPIIYIPPKKLTISDLETMPKVFMREVLDNFDLQEYGLGKGQKSIQPRTWLYLLENVDPRHREQAVQRVAKSLERAVEQIYDPVEGGFFRYAEKRNWQIPHYEKFADLNAGALLLLHKSMQVSPSPKLKQAADTTLAYLNSTLFDDDVGAFLSFQIADTDYYVLSKSQRKTTAPPKVMEKIFTDRLAVTLGYLIQVMEYTEDMELENNVRRSLNFLAEMVMMDAGMNHYYSLPEGQWIAQGGLADHAYVASLFTNAASHFEDARYLAVATKVVQSAVSEFYDLKKGIFIESDIDDSAQVEYLMELNGLLAESMFDLEPRLDSAREKVVDSLIAYYSLMEEVLEDRVWNAVDWEFTEFYVPYLRALEKYFSHRLATHPN